MVLFVQRIAVATEQLGRRDDGADAEIVGMVTTMLGEHPWRRRGPA
jgi:colicin import membrane protein